MTPKLKLPPSKLASLKKAIAGVLPHGLPKDIAKHYAKSDGLQFALGNEKNELVGLAKMFGGLKKGAFQRHSPVKMAGLDELEWSSRPFYEVFFNEHGDVADKKSLDSLNLRMRLKLLVSVAGESTELGIDFFSGPPCIYYVNRGDEAHPLTGLSFEDFVHWFSKFGARRWYFAFLDKKAEATLNLDLRRELESSLADFPPADWAPLLARFPKKRDALKPAVIKRESGASAAPVDVSAFPAMKDPPLVFAKLDKDSPRGIAFTDDGRRLVIHDGNYGLSVINVATLERAWKAKSVEFSGLAPDGQTLAVAEQSTPLQQADRVTLRSVANGKPVVKKAWQTADKRGLLGLTFSSDGKRVAVADLEGTLHVLDAATLSELSSISRVKHVRQLAAVPGSSHVLAQLQQKESGGNWAAKSTVKVFDLATGAQLEEWAGVRAFAITADGALLALRQTKPDQIQILERSSGRVLHRIEGATRKENLDYGFHMRFSPDGASLVVTDCDEVRVATTVSVFDVATAVRRHHIDTLGRNPRHPDRMDLSIDADGLAVSRDGLVCVATGADGLRFWKI